MASIARVWLSHTSDYENFEEDVKDSSSFSLGIPTTNDISWVEGVDSLMIGTNGEEWRIYATKLDAILTPTNFSVRMQSGFGSNSVQPVVANAVILFADSIGRKLHELVWDDLRQRYSAPDMTELAEHITATGIVGMSLQKNPNMIVWCALYDGSLLSFSYDREQNITAWADHPMDGTVQSVGVVPNSTAGEDEVWISISRTINSTPTVFIEKFNTRVIPAAIADCFFVDCGITYSGAATNTLSAAHLTGKTVSVLGNGVVYNNLTVVAGVVTLPAGVTVTKAQIGLPYTPELEPMRLDMNTPKGTSLGSVVRIPEFVLSLLDSAGVKYGDSQSNLLDVNITSPDLINKSAVTGLFTGSVPVSNVAGFDSEDRLLITSSDPLPLTVRAIIPKVEVTGR